MSKIFKSNSFLVLGRAGIDLYADPPGAKVEEAGRFTSALGGSAANIAAGVSRLGSKASLVTVLSDDAVGRFVRRELERYGVGSAHAVVAGGECRTSLAVVETRIEDCQSVIYRNGAADFALRPEDVEDIPFSEYAALIVTGTALAAEPSRSATFRAISLARAVALPVILDVDYRPYSWSDAATAAATCMQAAEASGMIIGNDVEFGVMAQGADGLSLARELAAGRIATVYKLGEKGSVTFAAGESFETPVFPVTALKPTGAGDAFMAGLVTGLAASSDLAAAVRRGAAAAAIVVTRVGCAPASPTTDELDTFLRRHTPAA
jgi:5-dehydro-2-deoxygluconokinase